VSCVPPAPPIGEHHDAGDSAAANQQRPRRSAGDAMHLLMQQVVASGIK
jgi:hypothetical protein